MMQMLERGGLAAVTDGRREADPDNPRGYLEFEPVKNTKNDSSWLPTVRGKVVKMVSALLYDLPATERYRVLFMERELTEVLESQKIMLRRAGRSAGDDGLMKQAYAVHLERLFRWIPRQAHLQMLKVSYNRLLTDPAAEIERVAAYLHRPLDRAAMLAAIDGKLYRNRSTLGADSGTGCKPPVEIPARNASK